MITCVNTGTSEFRALQERSGLPEFLLEVLVGDYQVNHEGAWPHLDELPIDWIDSKKALDQFLELNSSQITTQENLLQKTGTQSIPEAIVYLNDIYRNLDIDYYTINDKIKIITDGRPNPFRVVHTPPIDISNLSSTGYINQALNELERKLGIVTINTTTAELTKMGLLDIIPEASTAAAFVYQGDIYINEDLADVDAKVHELLHILLGSFKFKNPELYSQIVSIVEELENYQDLITRYPNRTRMDINEEIFVREYAKMLTSNLDSKNYQTSLLSQLNSDIIYNLNYEMSRVLDTMLRGDNSVRVIPASERFNKSFRELGEIVNAHNMENSMQNYVDASLMHRILANKKSDLMKDGKLKEYCN